MNDDPYKRLGQPAVQNAIGKSIEVSQSTPLPGDAGKQPSHHLTRQLWQSFKSFWQQLVAAPLAIKALLTVLCVLLVSLSTSIYMQQSSYTNASRTSQVFILALNRDDTRSAYKMTSTDIQSKQSLAAFSSHLGNLHDSQPRFHQQTTLVGPKIASYSTIEDGLPRSKNGSTSGTFTLTLSKAGLTGWKVAGVQVQ